MYQYGQYCPIARATEILADRWTILIVRELLVDVNNFNELERGLPRISRPLLSERLRRLVRAGLLERRAQGRGKKVEYRLTKAGQELRPIIRSLGEWGAKWAFGEPRPSELHPGLLLWWMRRRICFDALPRPRVIIQFDFQGAVRRTLWLLIGSTDASICLKHPGFDIDITVTADITSLYQVWLGRSTLKESLRKRGVRLEGSPADVQAFPNWFALSQFAKGARSAFQSVHPQTRKAS